LAATSFSPQLPISAIAQTTFHGERLTIWCETPYFPAL
jgi:hypothetical protein